MNSVRPQPGILLSGKPPAEPLFTVIRVSTYVNKPANDDANCFTPAVEESHIAAAMADTAASSKKKPKAKPVDERQASLF